MRTTASAAQVDREEREVERKTVAALTRSYVLLLSLLDLSHNFSADCDSHAASAPHLISALLI